MLHKEAGLAYLLIHAIRAYLSVELRRDPRNIVTTTTEEQL